MAIIRAVRGEGGEREARVLRWRSSVGVTGGTSRHLSTPKRLALAARLLPRPSRRSWGPDPAATHLSAFAEVMGPLPLHASVDSPTPRRQAAASVQGSEAPRAGGGLSAAAGCGEHTVPWSPAGTATGGRRDYRNRGGPAVSRLIKAAVRPLPSASWDPACASSGRCGRPAGAARRLSAWRLDRELGDVRPSEAIVRCQLVGRPLLGDCDSRPDFAGPPIRGKHDHGVRRQRAAPSLGAGSIADCCFAS